MEFTKDSEDINEWQEIQHPFPEASPTVLQTGGGWNAVVIRENYLLGHQSSVFPPTNHQDLQIVPIDPDHQASENGNSPPQSPLATSSSSSSPVSDENAGSMPPPPDWRSRVANEGGKLLKLRFEAIRARLVHVAFKVRNFAVCVGAFWSITCMAGLTAAALTALVYVGIQRRRLRVGRRRMDHLVYLLREKDEKITQLLLQIAQLNEVLSSRRKVPVLRISSSAA